MVARSSSDAGVSQHLEHQAPASTDNSSTMSTSAKPKSSTSEAAKTQKKRRTITRCSESDEEGIEDLINEPAKPKTISSETTKSKTSTSKKQVTPESIDSDHEDEEDSEDDDGDEESSDDEQTNTKTRPKAPVKMNPLAIKKQTSTKKQVLKRAVDSDDGDVVEVASKPKKSKTQPAASSSSKKQTAVSTKRKPNNDSDDDIIEIPSKTTKTKSNANPKQPVKPSSSTLTKKQTFKASKQPPAETDSDSEEDSSDEEEAPNITISERKGNLFEAPDNTLLLHACNCVGSWGAGIALAFKKHYPDHFAIYKAHCDAKTPNSILSTCLLIPPQPTGPKHWIGCLFTSKKYGRGKDGKDDIMDSTDSALQDMLEQLGDMKEKPERIWMCKINSGSFKVPWSQTKALIEALTFKDGLHIYVVDKK
ncbi:hypothetical protein KCU95_g6014, partial [Aureobasidium melanogenum]